MATNIIPTMLNKKGSLGNSAASDTLSTLSSLMKNSSTRINLSNLEEIEGHDKIFSPKKCARRLHQQILIHLPINIHLSQKSTGVLIDLDFFWVKLKSNVMMIIFKQTHDSALFPGLSEQGPNK